MDKPQIVIVVGRSLENYWNCGAAIEPDFTVLSCAQCKRDTAFSPEGRQRMTAFTDAGVRIMTLCTPCALILAPAVPRESETIYTKCAEAQAERSEHIKEILSKFHERMGTGR